VVLVAGTSAAVTDSARLDFIRLIPPPAVSVNPAEPVIGLRPDAAAGGPGGGIPFLAS